MSAKPPMRMFIKRLLKLSDSTSDKTFKFSSKKESDTLCLVLDLLGITYTQKNDYSVFCPSAKSKLSYFHTDIVWTGSGLLNGGSKLLKDIPLHRVRTGNATIEAPDRALKISEVHASIDAMNRYQVIEALRQIRVHDDYDRIKLQLPAKSQKSFLKQYYDILEHFKFNSASDKKFTANSFKFQLHSLGIETNIIVTLSNYDSLWQLILDNIYKLIHLEKQCVKTDSNCLLLLDAEVVEVWPYMRKIHSRHYASIIRNYRPFAYEFLTARSPEEREQYKYKMDESIAQSFISLPEGLDLSLKESFVYILLNNFNHAELATIVKEYQAYARNSDNPEYSKGRNFEICSLPQLVEAASLYDKDKTFTQTSVVETLQMHSDRNPDTMNKADARRLCASIAKSYLKRTEPSRTNLSAYVSRTVNLQVLSKAFPIKRDFVHYCKEYNLLPVDYTSKGSSADVLEYIQKTHPLTRSKNLIVPTMDMTDASEIKRYFKSIHLLPDICIAHLPSLFFIKQFKYLYEL